MGLPEGVALLGGFAKPREGLRVVLRHALARAYIRPEDVLRVTWPCSAALRYHDEGLSVVMRFGIQLAELLLHIDFPGVPLLLGGLAEPVPGACP